MFRKIEEKTPEEFYKEWRETKINLAMMTLSTIFLLFVIIPLIREALK